MPKKRCPVILATWRSLVMGGKFGRVVEAEASLQSEHGERAGNRQCRQLFLEVFWKGKRGLGAAAREWFKTSGTVVNLNLKDKTPTGREGPRVQREAGPLGTRDGSWGQGGGGRRKCKGWVWCWKE